MRAWLFAVLFAVSFAAPARAQQLLTPREFGDAAIAVIHHDASNLQIERVDDLGFVRRGGDLPEATMNLGNFYTEYLRNPARLTEILDRYSRFSTQPTEQVQMRERIVSVVRPRAMIDEFVAASAAARDDSNLPPSELVWRPFAGDLVEVIAFDGAETIQYALVSTLAEIDISPADAWAVAPLNLPARIGELQGSAVQGTDRLMFVTGVNGLTPSQLTDRNLCSAEGTQRLIFLVVDRNGYVAADRTDRAALAEFRALHQELMLSGDTMSATPIACDRGAMSAVLTD